MKAEISPDKIFDLPIPIPGHEGSTHLYLIQSTKNALIDTGPASPLPLVFAKLRELHLDPQNIDFILSSHIHLDHLGGLSQALLRMPRARVIVHPRGIPHLIHPEKLWQASLEMSGQVALAYGQPEPVGSEKLTAAEEGRQIDLGGIRLEIIFTPGHAAHHLSYIDRQNGNLFAGEAAGVYFPDSGVIRPASPPPFDLAQTHNSLNKMIATQPRQVYYSHFGFARPGLAKLKNFCQQLELWQATVSRFFTPHRELDSNLVELIVDEIMTQDGSKSQMRQFSDGRQKTEIFFLRNNVRGFWSYLQQNSSSTNKP